MCKKVSKKIAKKNLPIRIVLWFLFNVSVGCGLYQSCTGWYRFCIRNSASGGHHGKFFIQNDLIFVNDEILSNFLSKNLLPVFGRQNRRPEFFVAVFGNFDNIFAILLFDYLATFFVQWGHVHFLKIFFFNRNSRKLLFLDFIEKTYYQTTVWPEMRTGNG